MTEQEKRKHRCCFTGHRPEKLEISEENIKTALKIEIEKAIESDFNVFISGMARGVDIWAGEIVLGFKKIYPNIKLICASPYEGFESRWSDYWKEKYVQIISKADLIRFVCPEFSYSSYQIRNEWMVNHSSRVIAVCNGKQSGTKNTIDYAKKNGVEVCNIYNMI